MIMTILLASAAILPSPIAQQDRRHPPRTERRESEYQRAVRERREDYRSLERARYRERVWRQQRREQREAYGRSFDDLDEDDGPSMDSID